MRNDFAVFITTHGRADSQLTLNTLLANGYKGAWYLVVDDTDTQIEAYIHNHGADRVIVFNKAHFMTVTESCLVVPHPKAVVFARNAVEYIAQQLGYKYFMVVDDDIFKLRYRYIENSSLRSANLGESLDSIFDLIVEYMDSANIACMTFGFTNAYRGGVSAFRKFGQRNRFCAELFIRRVNIPVSWRANFVEDLVTSIDAGIRGEVFLQFIPIQLELYMSEGEISGGMSDAYLQTGRYKFYSLPVVIYPNCISVELTDNKWRTRTNARYSVPQIISSRYKKAN